MDKQERLIFRYDNAPHHSDVSSFPHHKHLPDGVAESEDKGIIDVLDEIEVIMSESIMINKR